MYRHVRFTRYKKVVPLLLQATSNLFHLKSNRSDKPGSYICRHLLCCVPLLSNRRNGSCFSNTWLWPLEYFQKRVLSIFVSGHLHVLYNFMKTHFNKIGSRPSIPCPCALLPPQGKSPLKLKFHLFFSTGPSFRPKRVRYTSFSSPCLKRVILVTFWHKHCYAVAAPSLVPCSWLVGERRGRAESS